MILLLFKHFCELPIKDTWKNLPCLALNTASLELDRELPYLRLQRTLMCADPELAKRLLCIKATPELPRPIHPYLILFSF